MYPKVAQTFRCKACDYNTSRRSNWTKHLTTRKHQILTDTDVSATKSSKTFECECGRIYKHRQSLFTHKKKCTYVPPSEPHTENEIVSATNELEELSKADLLNVIREMIPKLGNTTTTNNSINVQVFLDEKCKDAMTIQNFATQLTMTIEDILKHKQSGMPTGVSNILIENLRPIPLTERPIHCTDVKKRTWMVNDETEGWKEDNGKIVIKEAGFGINKRFQDLWNAAYPNWQYNEQLQKHWVELVQVLNADPSEKEIEKALKRIGPECKLTTEEIKQTIAIEQG